jgi:aminoglycoside 3'-phosphotransferase-2
LGNSGIADQYQDIALMVRSLTSNFGKEWVEVFLEAYGLENTDWDKIKFYQLLDEFF